MTQHQVEEFIRAEQKRVESTYADQYQALLDRIDKLEQQVEQMRDALASTLSDTAYEDYRANQQP